MNRRDFIKAGSSATVPLLYGVVANGQALSLKDAAFVSRSRISASGPNTYYYSQPQGSGTPADTYSGSIYVVWGTISVAQSGTCNEIGVYCSAYGSAANIKLGLYDSVGNRLANPSSVSVNSTGWKSASISQSVTVGTYYVAWIADGTTVAFERNSAGTNVGRSSDTPNTYAGGLPSTLPANANPPSGQPTVRMFVQ